MWKESIAQRSPLALRANSPSPKGYIKKVGDRSNSPPVARAIPQGLRVMHPVADNYSLMGPQTAAVHPQSGPKMERDILERRPLVRQELPCDSPACAKLHKIYVGPSAD